MKLKYPALFLKIIMLIFIDLFGGLFSNVILHEYYYLGYLLLLALNIAMISTIRTVQVANGIITFSNIFGVRKMRLEDLKDLELFYRRNKSGLEILIFRFVNTKIRIEYTFYNLWEVKRIIHIASESGVKIKINSLSEWHQSLKKYENI